MSDSSCHHRGTSSSPRRYANDVIPRRTPADFMQGIALICLVVVLWTLSSFLTNWQLTQGHYDKPFAFAWLNTSSFAVYLLPFLLVQRRHRHAHLQHDKDDDFLSRLGFVLPKGSIWTSLPPSNTYTAIAIDESRPSHEARQPPLDMHQTAVLAAHFLVVWFLANYTLNAALAYTSVASAVTISSASSFFTLAMGAAVGVERFTFVKLAAVVASFIGVMMITRADSTYRDPQSSGPTQPLLGDMLALASAFFYTTYLITLKRRIVREDRVCMPLLFGFVGLFNITAMWPFALLLHILNVERLQLPPSRAMWLGIIMNMSITVISDFAYLLAMLKSSPLLATVGLSLTIPLAMLGDIARNTHSGGAQSYMGAVVIVAGFAAIGIAARREAR